MQSVTQVRCSTAERGMVELVDGEREESVTLRCEGGEPAVQSNCLTAHPSACQCFTHASGALFMCPNIRSTQTQSPAPHCVPEHHCWKHSHNGTAL